MSQWSYLLHGQTRLSRPTAEKDAISDMSSAISVTRPLSSLDASLLRGHMPRINRRLQMAASLKWRPPGRMGVTLLERGEYETAVDIAGSALADVPVTEVTERIQSALCGDDRKLVPADTIDVQFLGSGQYGYLQIVYLLDQARLKRDRQAITEAIDQLATIPIRWRGFLPHISLATIDLDSAEESLLESFRKIMPASLNFMPVRVI